MNGAAIAAGVSVVGAAVALAAWWGVAMRDTAPGAGPARSAAVDTVAPPPIEDGPLVRIEQRLGDLALAVARLEQRFDSSASPGSATALERTPADASAAVPVPLEIEALARALELAAERREEKRLAGRTDDELRAEAMRLANDAKDPWSARRALEALLARRLPPDERTGALTQFGMVLRSCGDLDGSARNLQAAIDAAGADSALGLEASYQLVWTLERRKEPARALEVADGLARSVAANPSLKLHARWAAAMLAHDLGDSARARRDYEALLRDCENGGDDVRAIADSVRRRLATLPPQ